MSSSAGWRQRLGGLAAGLLAAAVVTAGIWALRDVASAHSLSSLYVLATLPVAMRWGVLPALVCALASVLAFDYFFVRPVYALTPGDAEDWAILSATTATAVVVSALAGRVRARAHEAEALAREQAALRRVATLVARAAPTEQVFTAVLEEVAVLLGVDFALLSRYDADGSATIVAAWRRSQGNRPEVGTLVPPGRGSLHALVFERGLPARIDDYSRTSGVGLDVARDDGVQSGVAAPIHVGDQVWGVILVAYTHEERLPKDTEVRLTGFGDLVATAIANAAARADVMGSRARLVATADATRRAIERNLHDGAQQRLVSLALQIRAMQGERPQDAHDLGDRLGLLAAELTGVIDELRETAQGIHPSILVEGGIRPALRSLARRSAVPVNLDVATRQRFSDQTEVAAYYVVAEALTNAAKHADASEVDVSATTTDEELVIRVRDDGRGGAMLRGGSGLVGLRDRVEAVGGVFRLHSPPGTGTTVEVALPIDGMPEVT